EHSDDPVGPLFWAHYSYLGLNPKGLTDQYGDYWTLNQNHAKIHYRYCVDNPNDFEGYGENCWGLTSSYSMKGYSSHQPTRDLGVISPTAALSSFPYTPEESMQFLRYLYEEQKEFIGEYGPYDAFSLENDWYLPRYLAIDQGPIPVMIENYRTQLLWNLFMKNQDVQNGLNKLGFSYEK
ncbi:MAG: glucoamylase family protein, partial [Bacteroidota bacterium]